MTTGLMMRTSKDYNNWKTYKGNPQINGSHFERMNHELYKYGAVINYNTNPIHKRKRKCNLSSYMESGNEADGWMYSHVPKRTSSVTILKMDGSLTKATY